MEPSLTEQITALVAEERGVPSASVTPASRLLEDLGMDGDDAVEFFEEFERRYGLELTPLHRNWQYHFNADGIGFYDYRVNYALIATVLVIVAALANWLPSWTLVPAGILLLIVTSVGVVQERRRRPQTPITVADLIKVATTRRWPHRYR